MMFAVIAYLSLTSAELELFQMQRSREIAHATLLSDDDDDDNAVAAVGGGSDNGDRRRLNALALECTTLPPIVPSALHDDELYTLALTRRVAQLVTTAERADNDDDDDSGNDDDGSDNNDAASTCQLQLPVELREALVDSDDRLLSASTSHAAPRRRYRTCAVVGNSAILSGAGHGAAIDAADLVVRFNFPPLAARYRADVGARADVMFTGGGTWFASHHAPFASFRNFSRLRELYLFAHSDLADALGRLRAWRAEPPPKPALRFVSPFWKFAVNTLLRRFAAAAAAGAHARNEFGLEWKATSGLRGVVAAAAMCAHTHVYGFGTHAVLGNGHYYANASYGAVFENPGHNYSVEHALLARLATPPDADAAAAAVPIEPCTVRLGVARDSDRALSRLLCGAVTLHTENAVAAVHEDELPEPRPPQQQPLDQHGRPQSRRQRILDKASLKSSSNLKKHALVDDERFWRDRAPSHRFPWSAEYTAYPEIRAKLERQKSKKD